MAQSTEDNRALERKAFLNWKIDARDSAELHSLLSKHCLLDPKEKSPREVTGEDLLKIYQATTAAMEQTLSPFGNFGAEKTPDDLMVDLRLASGIYSPLEYRPQKAIRASDILVLRSRIEMIAGKRPCTVCTEIPREPDVLLLPVVASLGAAPSATGKRSASPIDEANEHLKQTLSNLYCGSAVRLWAFLRKEQEHELDDTQKLVWRSQNVAKLSKAFKPCK